MKILFILLLIGTFEVIQTKRLDKPVRSPAKHVHSSKKIKEVKRYPDKNILFKIDDNDEYYLIKTYFNSALAKLNDIEEGKLNDEVPLLSKVKIATANAVLSAYIEYTLKRTLKISLNDVPILKKDDKNKSNTKNGVTIAELLHLILQEAKKANYEDVCEMYPEISLPNNIKMKSKFMRDYIEFVNHVIEGANFEGTYIDESYVHKFEPELNFINSTNVNSTGLSQILNSTLDPTKQQKWSIVSSRNPPQSVNSSKLALSTTHKLPPSNNEKENNSKIEINHIPPINKFNPKDKFTDAFKFVPKVTMQTRTDPEPIKWKDFISKIKNEAKVEVTQIPPSNIDIPKNTFLDSNKIRPEVTIPNIFEATTPAAIKWKDFISEIETGNESSFEDTLMAPLGINSNETGEITTRYLKETATPTIESVTVLPNYKEVTLPDKYEVITPNDLNPKPIKWKDFIANIKNSLTPPSNTNIPITSDISTPLVPETTTPNKNIEKITPDYQTVTLGNAFTESTKFGPEGTIPNTYEVTTPNALEPATIKWKDFISKFETENESSFEDTLMAPLGINSHETGKITTRYLKETATPTIESVTVLPNYQEVTLPDKYEEITPNDLNPEPIKWKDFIANIENENESITENSLTPTSNTNIPITSNISTQLVPETTTPNQNIEKITSDYQTVTFENTFTESTKFEPEGTIPSTYEVTTPNALEPATIKWKDFISKFETENESSFEVTLMPPPDINSFETVDIITPYVKDTTTPTIESVTVLPNYRTVTSKDTIEEGTTPSINPLTVETTTQRINILKNTDSTIASTTTNKEEDLTMPETVRTSQQTTTTPYFTMPPPEFLTSEVSIENMSTSTTAETTSSPIHKITTIQEVLSSSLPVSQHTSELMDEPLTFTWEVTTEYQNKFTTPSMLENYSTDIDETITDTGIKQSTMQDYDTSKSDFEPIITQNTALSTEETVNIYSTNMGTYLISTTEYFDIADLEGTDEPVVITTTPGMSADSKIVECTTEPVTESPEDIIETIPYDFVNYKSHSNHLDSLPSYLRRIYKLDDQDTDKNNVHNESGVYKYMAVSQRQKVIDTKITKDSTDNYVNLNNTKLKSNDNIDIEKYASTLTEANDEKYDINNLFQSALHEIDLAVSDIIKRFCEIENNRNVLELICSLLKQQTLAYVKSLNSVLNNFDNLKEKTYVGQYFKPNYDLRFEKMQKQNYLRIYSYYISRCPHFVQLGPKYQKKTNEYSLDGPKLRSLLHNYPIVALDSKLTVSLIEHPKLVAGLWSHADVAESLLNIWGDPQ